MVRRTRGRIGAVAGPGRHGRGGAAGGRSLIGGAGRWTRWFWRTWMQVAGLDGHTFTGAAGSGVDPSVRKYNTGRGVFGPVKSRR